MYTDGKQNCTTLKDDAILSLCTIRSYQKVVGILIVRLFKFYGISIFPGYLMPNPFLYKLTVLFQTIQFSIST